MSSSDHVDKKMKSASTYVVIGGGIAGVCCAQELARINKQSVLLISSSDTLVESASIFTVTNHLDEIAVYERKTDQFKFSNPDIDILHGTVASINFEAKDIHLSDGRTIKYSKLCICTGVRPNLLANHEHILGLRDINSLETLTKRLVNARRVAVVGNGGISLELIHELRHIDIDWIVKDKYMGSVFFDATASAFIAPSLLERAHTTHSDKTSTVNSTMNTSDIPSSSTTSNSSGSSNNSSSGGYGLGPEWVTKFGFMKSQNKKDKTDDYCSGELRIHYEQQVKSISEDQGITWQSVLEDKENLHSSPTKDAVSSMGFSDYPLLIKTTTDEMFGVDFIISATGVQPNTEFLKGVEGFIPTLSEDGCIIVNELMQSSIKDVFAAGDCCSFQGKDTSELYFQMKLWTQARSMGVYAAQCMCECADQYGLDAQFEIFTHITRFFGYKVVMLGRYNGQGMNNLTEKLTKQIVVTSQGLVKNEWFTEEIEGDMKSSTNKNDQSEVEFWIRITPGSEYIKLVVLHGKVIGALLIGNTDLEEVFENLILNKLDVSQLGVDLLDPDIDIADYFD